MIMMFRNLYVKWQVWRGKAIDIWSKSPYPADVLSNLYTNSFYFEGAWCGSMEGLLQSLKYRDVDVQRKICAMSGKEAKNKTNSDWQHDQIVWWKGRTIDRQSQDFENLIREAYIALYQQNEEFRKALSSTKGLKLYHSRGEQNPHKTILTEKEFCGILTHVRDTDTLNPNKSSLPSRNHLGIFRNFSFEFRLSSGLKNL